VNKRLDELKALIPEDSLKLVEETLDDIVFLEQRLSELRKLPFIEVHPKNPLLQRNTPAAKMYKELLQQYINCLKLIEYVIYKERRLDGEEEEESPLRAYLKSIKKKYE
jgi:hypothetical protein